MAWSNKYKKSIDCTHPKGFSQKAHCQGRKKKENIMKVSEFKNFVREHSRTKYGKLFISKATKLHRGKYDYSLVEYTRAKDKVKIICSRHGIFEQQPHNHLCPRVA